MVKPKKSVVQVALVEDNYNDFELIKFICDQLSFQVELIHFEHGNDLLDFIQHIPTNPFAFFLIDLKSPFMDGRVILKKLKSMPGSVHCPAIIFSSSNIEADIRECFEAGASAYVAKPIDFEAFEQTIKSIFWFWGQFNLHPKA